MSAPTSQSTVRIIRRPEVLMFRIAYLAVMPFPLLSSFVPRPFLLTQVIPKRRANSATVTIRVETSPWASGKSLSPVIR